MSEKEGSLTPEIVKLTEKISRDPSSRLFVPLAEEYMKCGMQDEALIVLTDGIKIHPHYVGAHVSLGKLFWKQGKKDEAKKEFEQVIQANPDNILAHRYLIQVYQEECQWAKALDSCRLILSFNPKDSDMLILRDELEKKKSPKTVTDLNTGDSTSAAGAEKEHLLETTSFAQAEPELKTPTEPDPTSEMGVVSESEVPKDELAQSKKASAPGESPQPILSEGVENFSPTPISGEVQTEISEAPSPELEIGNSPAPLLKNDEPKQEETFGSESVEQIEKNLVMEDIQPSMDEPLEDLTVSEPYKDDAAIEISEDQEDDLKTLEAAFSSSSEIDFAPEETSRPQNETVMPVNDPPQDIEENLKSHEPNLKTSPKIKERVPSPAVGQPEGGPSIEQGDFASESLAELYVRQGFYKKGIEIYNRLISEDPNNKNLKQKLNDAISLAKLLTGFNEGNAEDPKSKEEMNQPVTQRESKFSESRVAEKAMDPASISEPSIMKTDPKSQKIQRLQAWLENIKKGQST